MEKHPAKSINWWRAATAVLLLSLVTQVAGCDNLHPSAGQAGNRDNLSHHPTTFHQMEQLVTPDDPAVKQALYDALNPIPSVQTPATVSGVNNNPVPANNTLSDFELIIEWVNAHCIYTTDQEDYGVADYWASPAETIALGAGDCEDYSILLCSLLRAYGVPWDEAYVAVGYDSSGNAHSWLVEKYYTGIWRLLDTQRGSEKPLVFGSLLAAGYTTSYCFNDTDAFYGEPVLPAGVYEFESVATSYPVDSGSTNSYSRYLNAGQKVTAQVGWLPYSVYWPFNPNILEPWSCNIYDANGNEVFSWSGTDTQKTLDYTVSQTGEYRIEIVKRDNPARPIRLTLDPQDGWTTGMPLRIDLLRVVQPPFPNKAKSTVVETPLDTTSAVWQNKTPRVPAPMEVPRQQLVQQALDTINTERASKGLAPIELGNNTAAQQHAYDMLAHDFVSGWGTDGTTPDERYTLAGGLGSQTEYDYRTDIGWNRDPSSFANALLAAIEQTAKDHAVSWQGYYFVYTSSGTTYTEADTEQFKIKSDKVNIGVAYDGEYLYLVVQYESFYITFSQLPNIQDGLLSFTGQCALGSGLYSVDLHYQRLPSPLTAAQISYASGSDGARWLASFYSSIYGPKGYFISSPISSFLDPHCIPLDMPPLTVTGLNLTGLLNDLTIGITATSLAFNGFGAQGNQFSFSADISQIFSKFGKGVYTISVSGLTNTGYFIPPSTYTSTNAGYFIPQLFTYTIFVN